MNPDPQRRQKTNLFIWHDILTDAYELRQIGTGSCTYLLQNWLCCINISSFIFIGHGSGSCSFLNACSLTLKKKVLPWKYLCTFVFQTQIRINFRFPERYHTVIIRFYPDPGLFFKFSVPVAGLEKTRVFWKKNQPSGFFWGFFGFFGVFLGFFGFFSGFFAQTRGFLGVFSVSRILLGASRL